MGMRKLSMDAVKIDDRPEERRASDALRFDALVRDKTPIILTATRAGDGDQEEPSGPDTAVVIKSKPKTQRPSMYKVLLLNDDYTPMEFVVHVLERFFGMGHERAVQIMMTVHNRGVAVVGVFTYEIAETKVTQVMDFARQHQHPLQCAMEKE